MERQLIRRDAILIFVLLLISYMYVLPRWADWSQNSRLNLVRALVELDTTQIDAYVANTGDYAIYNDHSYTDKPPGLSFVGLPFYAAVYPLIEQPQVAKLLEKVAGGGALSTTLNTAGSGLKADKIHHFVAQALLSVVTVAIPAAALGSLLYVVLAWLGIRRIIRSVGTLAYGLATPAAAYAGNYYSHQFVAALLFGAFALLLMSPGRQQGIGLARALLFGLLSGFVVISEYPPAIIVAVLGIYALTRLRPIEIVIAILGGLPALVLMAAYDMAAFGTIWPVGYSHSALWQDQHHTGFMSITYPHPEAIWGLLFGSFRGLFVRAPWLLLLLPGGIAWWRSREQRGALWVCLLSALGLILFYSSSIMWWGGFGIGPRYLVPMLPFVALIAIFGLQSLWSQPLLKFASVVLILLSGTLTWLETLAGQSFPSDAIREPWLGYTLPAWQQGDIARNLGTALGLHGVLSLFPLVISVLVLLVVLMRSPGMPQPASQAKAQSANV